MHFTAVNVEAAALSGISGASYDQTKDLLEKIDVVPTEKLKGDEQKLGAVVADVEMLAVGSVWGVWSESEVAGEVGLLVEEGSRLLSSIERVSSNFINKAFASEDAIAAGWRPPYPDNLSLRKITTAQELKFYRVHVDPERVAGRFLAREKEIAPFLNDPDALRLHLGLPDVPIYITEVNVPANTKLLVGRIGPQPRFGLMDESGFQYQAINELPKSSFENTRLLLEPKLKFDISY